VIEVSDINGEEIWYEGNGWYWTDSDFMFHGPYLTEKGAVTDYAWYIHAVLIKVNEVRERINRPRLALPPGVA